MAGSSRTGLFCERCIPKVVEGDAYCFLGSLISLHLGAKGRALSLRWCMIRYACPPRRSPAITMLADPIEQSSFEANIVTQSFGLDPLVL